MLALVATPHSERDSQTPGRDLGGDFRVIDITDPSRPSQLAEWGVLADSRLHQSGGGGEIESAGAGIGGYAVYYGHSVRGADLGRTAYVSYWDAGVLKFDIGDPRRPRLVGRTSGGTRRRRGRAFGHRARPWRQAVSPPEPGGGGPALAAGRDLDGDRQRAPAGRRTAVGAAPADGDRCAHRPGTRRRRRLQRGGLRGRGGHARARRRARPGPCGPEPSVRRRRTGAARRPGRRTRPARQLRVSRPPDDLPLPPCPGVSRPAAKRDAGALRGGDLVDRRRGSRDPGGAGRGPLGTGDAGTAATRLRRGHRLRRDPRADITRRYAELSPRVVVHGRARHGRSGSPGPLGGATEWINAHNVEVRGTRAYASWYAGGIVALDVRTPGLLRRVGQFAPAGATFWGVDVDPKGSLVFGSDIASGLWILRPTR